MKRVIVSVSNDLATDQRVDKVCTTLHNNGFEVLLIGRRFNDSLPLSRPYGTKRFRLLFNKGPLFYIELNLRLFLSCLFSKADIFHSNDLDTLLPNYLVSVFRSKPLVYDTHEYFTGVPELQQAHLKRRLWKAIESFIFPKLKHIFTVNDSIAHLYFKDYGINPKVLRNVPKLSVTTELVKQYRSLRPFEYPIDKKIIMLQGAGINIHRGAEEAVLAMKHLDGCMLFIIGGGDVFPTLQNIIQKERLENKVVLMGKKAYSDLFQYTMHADLGLTLDKDTNINYRFSLPNKIFDYIHAGIPVLGSNLIEIKRIIDQYQVGKITPQVNPVSIAATIKEMFNDSISYQELKANCEKAKERLSWEDCESELLKTYSEL